MPTRYPVQTYASRVGYASPPEQRLSGRPPRASRVAGFGSRPPETSRHRPFSAGEHETDARGSAGKKHLPQPGVHQPEYLVVVENDQPRVAGGERAQEAAFGRLDRPAVQADSVGTTGEERVEER